MWLSPEISVKITRWTRLSSFREHNPKKEILSVDEEKKLSDVSPKHLKPILLTVFVSENHFSQVYIVSFVMDS
jgi:hypothetical protein